MSCNCNSALSALPPLPVPASVPASSAPCCSEDCSDSVVSEGTTLPSTWSDASCCTEMVLLGRSGSTLTRFVGSGFIKIVSGVASLVTSVPIKITTLWHRMYKVIAGSLPVPGEPLPFPYFTIADDQGNLHGIRGENAVDSVPVWNGTDLTFSFVPTGDLPACRKGSLDRELVVELVGFTPLSVNDATDASRCQVGMGGEGIVLLVSQDTVNGPVSAARVIDNPPSDGTYFLKCVNGVIAWVEEEI